FDFNYVSENQIRDGALKSVKALIVRNADVMEAATASPIHKWIAAGGLLVWAKGKDGCHTVEGDAIVFDEKSVIASDADWKDEAFRQFATDALAKAAALSAGTRGMVAADGKED